MDASLYIIINEHIFFSILEFNNIAKEHYPKDSCNCDSGVRKIKVN